jgi:ATP/maltotriose-dependent transcriptional regulator MalT/DNA-binding SARP family transcriptional activator
MHPHSSSELDIVKINCPSADGLFPRKRLFQILDENTSAPATWITAPAGSGKTSLVASYLASRKASFIWYQCDSGDRDLASFFYYLGLAAKRVIPAGSSPLPLLTPEYQHDIQSFSRNYFENLYHLLQPGSFLIIDNFQEVDTESKLSDLLASATGNVPETTHIIFISRNAPPKSMARLRMHNQLLQLEGVQMRLTRQETDRLVETYVHGELSSQMLATLYARSQGWVAGVILMLNQKNGQTGSSDSFNNDTQEILFDYFAGEVFESEPLEVQKFLLTTAFLHDFTEAMAKEISGADSAGNILRRLLLKNYFITKHTGGTFQYHPLFREFLLNRTEAVLDADKLGILLRRSAQLLNKKGQTEEAATLFARVKEYPTLIRIICEEAPKYIQRGQAKTIQSWINEIPTELQIENPWVLYWAGMCLLPYDLSLAKSQFEQAFEEQKKHDDITGQFAAWCGIAESILHALDDLSELDHWIVILDELLSKSKNTPPTHLKNHIAAAMFMSLVFRQPDHPEFSSWKAKAMDVLTEERNISLRIFTGFFLLSHSYWAGNQGIASKILQEIKAMAESPDAEPLAKIMGHFSVSWHGRMEGDYKTTKTAVDNGLQLSAQTGIVIWNLILKMQGTVSSLSEGNADEADIWLDELAANLSQCRRFDIFYYYHARAWQALIRGKVQEAYAYQQSALENIHKTGAKPIIGVAHFGMSQACHETGKFKERDYHLAECRRYGKLCNSRLYLFVADLGEAQYQIDNGETDCTVELLKQTMAIGSVEGYYNFSFWRTSFITPLIVFCLKHDIEVEYAQKIIRKRNLQTPDPPVELENWPWILRVYTLGRFSIIKNGVPLRFGKKSSIKILDLLKAIIAFGGRDVSESRLSDVLWPDSDGDAAHQALATTLFRLRKWLGVQNAIIRSEGLISINPYICWVDAWCIERLFGKTAQSEAPDYTLYSKAAQMYSGHFLVQDADKPWATIMRERLRSKMVRTIATVAAHQFEGDYHHDSIACYRRGIELDPLAEEFYQGLLKNYSARGETAKALKVYDELESILLAALNIEPSQVTQALYKQLLNIKN